MSNVRFDLKNWTQKAYDKYEKNRPQKGRRARASASPSSAKADLKKDISFIKKLQKISNWCDSKGIGLQFSGKQCEVNENGIININLKCTPETQVYSLLHECGHVLIGQTNKKFDNGYSTNDPNMKKSLLHRTDVLYEECEAWHRGWKLSKRLGIKLNKLAYDRYKTQCLKTYVRWFVKLSYPGVFRLIKENKQNKKR